MAKRSGNDGGWLGWSTEGRWRRRDEGREEKLEERRQEGKPRGSDVRRIARGRVAGEIVRGLGDGGAGLWNVCTKGIRKQRRAR